MNNVVLRNKRLYKIFLGIAKYLPIVSSIIQIITLILNYFVIMVPTIITCIGGTSLIFLVFLYLVANIFQFCSLYKIPIWYMFSIISVSILRNIGLLPIDLLNLYRLYIIITGICTTLFVIAVYKNKNNQKVDYIKQFCDRYCNC